MFIIEVDAVSPDDLSLDALLEEPLGLVCIVGPVAGWCGLVVSAATVWSVGAYTDISGLAYSAVGILACLAVGLVVGIVDRREPAAS